MRRPVLLALLLAAGPALAQETYRLEPAAPVEVGSTWRLVRANEERNQIGAIGLDRALLDRLQIRKQTLAGRVRVLAVEEGIPNGFEIRVERARIVEAEREQDPGLDGRRVRARGVRGALRFATADGSPLAPAAREHLSHGLHSLGSLEILRRAVAVDRELRPGDLWLVPVEPFARSAGLSEAGTDLTRSKATAHLERVVDRDGRRIAVVGFLAEIAPRVIDRVPVSRGILRYQGTIETALDGSDPYGRVEYVLDLAVETLFRADGRQVSVARRVYVAGTEEVLPIQDSTPAPSPR